MHTNSSRTKDLEDAVERYKRLVYGIAVNELNSRTDADDVFQNVVARQKAVHIRIAFKQIFPENAVTAFPVYSCIVNTAFHQILEEMTSIGEVRMQTV